MHNHASLIKLLLILATFVLACLFRGGAGQAATTAEGDPQLLSMIAAANEDNSTRLQTWTGHADVVDVVIFKTDGASAQETHLKAKATFLVDHVNNMKRWRWSIEQAQKRDSNGAIVDAPEMVEDIDEMCRPDGYFRVANGFRPVGSQRWQRTIVIWPPSRPIFTRTVTGDSFDPEVYVNVYRRSVSEYVKHLIELWPQFTDDAATLKVSRVGDIVSVVYTIKGVNTNSQRYDLSRGGNVVETKDNSARGSSWKSHIEYIQLNGVWIPSIYDHEANDKDGHQLHRHIVFTNTQINVPISTEEFTIQQMGVEPNTRVTDQRTGLAYVFGKESQTVALLNDSHQPGSRPSVNVSSNLDLSSHLDAGGVPLPSASENVVFWFTLGFLALLLLLVVFYIQFRKKRHQQA